MSTEDSTISEDPNDLVARYFHVAHRIAGLGIIVLDCRTNTCYVSNQVCSITGFPPRDKMDHEHLMSMVHPEDKARFSHWFGMLEAGDSIPEIEYRIIRNDDGDIRVLSSNATQEYNDDGTLRYLIGTIIDVTKRTEAETFLTSVFEQAPISMWISDANGTFLKQNQSCRELLHINDEDVAGTYNLFKDKISLTQGVMPKIERVFSQGEVVRFPLTYDISTLKKEREEKSNLKILNVTITPIKDQKGRVRNAVVQHVDITEQRQFETALRESEERYRTTLMSVADGVIATDADGQVQLMNPAAETLTGWKQAEAQGMPFAGIFHLIDESSRKPYEDPIQTALQNSPLPELSSQILLIAKDGREINISCSASHIRNSEDGIIGVVLVFRDITEKLKLINEIQKAQKLDALGVLAGGIAHDFNNLLGGLFGYIELARGASAEGSAARKHLDKALRVFSRTKDLTLQLLTFAKGGAPLRKTGYLGPLIKGTAQFALSGSNVLCEFTLPDDLWSCDFDENQLGQVIDNIVINAQQAMPDGGKITISAENLLLEPGQHPAFPDGGKHIRISIQDRGTGIPEHILPKIFDPFFTTKQKGSGIGLSSAYSILKRHSGFIDVETFVGKGSTFHIYLPASSSVVVFESRATDSTHKGKGSVLIMDDQPQIAEVAQEMLEDMGYVAVVAKDGEEAIHLFSKAQQSDRPYCMAILDLTIPGGIGGKQVVAELRRMNLKVPIVASSGYSEDPVMADPEQYGFNYSLPKPYRMSDLSELLNRAFGEVH